MADYINPQSIDPYANVQANPESYVQTPAAILGQLQNRQTAEQMYQNALANQQLDLEAAQRKGVAETQMEDILSPLRQDPRFAEVLRQSKLNELLGPSGENALKYLKAVQEARDVTMAPMFETKDPRVQEYLLRTGGQALGQLGLTSPELPAELTQAFPILQAQNVRYRRGQEFQAKRDLQQLELDARMMLEQLQQRGLLERARISASQRGRAGGLPKTLDSAFIQSFVASNGRMPTTEEIAAYLAQKPQNVPELAGERRAAQLAADPTQELTRGVIGYLKQKRPDLFPSQGSTIPQRGAAPAAQQPKGPQGFTSKGGVKFTVE